MGWGHRLAEGAGPAEVPSMQKFVGSSWSTVTRAAPQKVGRPMTLPSKTSENGDTQTKIQFFRHFKKLI